MRNPTMKNDSFVYPLDPKVAHGMLVAIAGIHPGLAEALAAVEATLVDPTKPAPPGYDAAVADSLIRDAWSLLMWSQNGNLTVRDQKKSAWIDAAKAFFARQSTTTAVPHS
jgi:hypothetical protein